MSDLAKQLDGYRLATAHILYHMPDHPALLQEFVWQNLDKAPHFPRLIRFLDFWQDSIEAKLHSVKVATAELIAPNRYRLVVASHHLH